jgi:Ca-activated chloride channel family protein
MEKIPLERYEWPLALAIFCLIIEFLLPDRRRPAKAAALPSAARRHAVPGQTAVLLTIGLLSLLSPTGVRAEIPDAKVLYNNGTAAYAAGEFQTAADTLRDSLNTTDLTLQNRAYYNLGNALYRIGQAAQAENVEATLKSWEEALKAYSDALALDASDTDARFNHDLVKRKLDELKKQNPDKNKDDQKKDGKDQKDGEKDDKEKKDGEQKDGEKQDGKEKSKEGKDGEKQDGQKPGEEKEGEPEKEGQEGDAEKQEKKEGKETGSGAEKDKDGKEKGTKEGETGEQKEGTPKPGEEKSSTDERRQVQQKQMTAEEAKQLLNMMRGEQRTVIPMERPPQRGRFIDPNNTTKGKTW